jgi:2-keto-4-pentenoate hydratase
MMSDMNYVTQCAKELWAAECNLTPVDPFTSRSDKLSRHEAYLVQLEVASIRRKLGHRVVGKKVGLVSKAMQEMAGFAEPDYGHLFDQMRIEDGATIRLDSLIQPRIEPEVAFVLNKPLRGPNVTVQDVLAATAFVAASLEIVDSRIKDWKIRWVDTVADNGSSSRFVLSEQAVSPLGLDFRTMGMVLEVNSEPVVTSVMTEVLGNPVRAVCWLANKLHEWEIGLEAGDVILPGSPCRAIAVNKGDRVTAHMAGLGSVSLAFA